MNLPEPKMNQVESMGMITDNWIYKSCIAMVGVGEDWATIYMISSDEQGNGHATDLLTYMKNHYENQEKVFGSSIALNSRMKHLLQKLNIIEYAE